jgi:transposase-like protein
MQKKSKHYTPEFKFKVVLESYLKGNVTEVARLYHVHPNQLSLWRNIFKENGYLVFNKDENGKEDKLKKKIESLENLIGKKEIEINLLKKYLDFYAPNDGS